MTGGKSIGYSALELMREAEDRDIWFPSVTKRMDSDTPFYVMKTGTEGQIGTLQSTFRRLKHKGDTQSPHSQRQSKDLKQKHTSVPELDGNVSTTRKAELTINM